MLAMMIVAHTPLASALLDFVEHVYGEIPEKIFAIDVPPHEDSKVTLQKLQDLVDTMGSNQEILILTDILGATPNNVAIRLVQKNHAANLRIQILTGVNLPMLLRAVSHRGEPINEVVEKSLLGGQNGVLKMRDTIQLTV